MQRVFLFCVLFLASCSSAPVAQPASLRHPSGQVFVFRSSNPALIELSEDFQIIREHPVSFPPDCGLFDIFPAPRGNFFAIELSCSFGQTVFFFDVETDSVKQAFAESDSHFLAWTNDGEAAYLKVDSSANSRTLRVAVNGVTEKVSISEFTYDLAPDPTSDDFLFTFSRGLGFGSELWLAQKGVNTLLYADEINYLSFARWSPDGQWIAFIKIPDSQTPFTIGELWIMDKNGSNPRFLARADAGHGYAANWSPDGKQLAFVARENADDPAANRSVNALVGNIYVVDVSSGVLTQITHFKQGRAETPHWSPDGKKLFFQSVINGRMDAQVVDLTTGESKFLLAEPACCPSWLLK